MTALARTTDRAEYFAWVSMRQRCRNPRALQYHNYGARGIAICERWNSFAAFLADMGRCPSGHSIDRINGDGNYEPGNCRWAPPATQTRNRSAVRLSMAAAREIRELRKMGARSADIAERFEVSRAAVNAVLRGRQWRDDDVYVF